VLVALTRCSSLYLHDPQVQQSTADAKASLVQQDLLQPFQSQSDYLTKLASDETAATKAQVSATRALLLLDILDNNGWQKTASYVQNRVKELIGKQIVQQLDIKSPNGQVLPGDLFQIARRLRDDPVKIRNTQVNVDITSTRYKDSGGTKPTDCGMLTPDPRDPDDNQNGYYQALWNFCRDRQAQQDDLNNARSIFTSAAPNSILGETNATLVSLKNDLKDQQDKAEKLDANLATLKKEIEQETQKQQTDTAKSRADQLNKILTQDLPKAEPLVKYTRSKFIENQLQAVLTAALNPTADPQTMSDPTTRSALAAIQSINALATFIDAFSNPPKVPQPDAILVALAYQKYQTDEAEAGVNGIKARIAIFQEREQVITVELSHLAVAFQATINKKTDCRPAGCSGFGEILMNKRAGSANDRDAASSALTEMNYAWSVGRLPLQVSMFKEAELNRQLALDQEQRIAIVWIGLLQPALDELATYGQGGITPQTLSNIIQALGFTAIGAKL
jgi:hypothetical protein